MIVNLKRYYTSSKSKWKRGVKFRNAENDGNIKILKNTRIGTRNRILKEKNEDFAGGTIIALK